MRIKQCSFISAGRSSVIISVTEMGGKDILNAFQSQDIMHRFARFACTFVDYFWEWFY